MILFLNLLNFLNVVLVFVFQLLLLRTLGASLETDAYFLSLAIVQFLGGVATGFLTDLFVPVYNDLKAADEEGARRFSGAVLLLALTGGLALALFVIVVAPDIVRFFASGFDEPKVVRVSDVLRVMALMLPFSTSSLMLQQLLTANLRMGVIYWTNLLVPSFGIAATLLYGAQGDLLPIVAAVVLASGVSFSILWVYGRVTVGWKLANPFAHSSIPSLVRQSMPVRLGNLVYLLRIPLTSNVLSLFPTGMITLFNYADKVLSTLFNVTNSPLLQVLYAKASALLPAQKLEEVKQLLLNTLTSNNVLIVAAVLPTTMLFQPAFELLLSPRVGSQEIGTMFVLFVTLLPFYLTLSFEVPFVNVLLALKRGTSILLVNAVFILLYAAFLFVMLPQLGVFAIPLALFMAQLQNTASFMRRVHERLPFALLDVLRHSGKLFLVLVLYLTINLFVRHEYLLNFFANLALAVVWGVLAGRETLGALQMLTRKGEVR